MMLKTGDYLLHRLPYIVCFIILAIPMIINTVLSFTICAETIVPTLYIISSNFYEIPLQSFILLCCILSMIVVMPFSIRICKTSAESIITSFGKYDVLKSDKDTAYSYLFFVILHLTIMFVLLTSFIWVVCLELTIAVIIVWQTSSRDRYKNGD